MTDDLPANQYEDETDAVRAGIIPADSVYCRHGNYVGNPYGGDYMCGRCEDGDDDGICQLCEGEGVHEVCENILATRARLEDRPGVEVMTAEQLIEELNELAKGGHSAENTRRIGDAASWWLDAHPEYVEPT